MSKQRIHISIALPMIVCDDRYQCIPLNPICDEIGMDWKTQERKLLNDDCFIERFGLILGVARYPTTDKIGSKGNQDANSLE
jgi:hypothetical protein